MRLDGQQYAHPPGRNNALISSHVWGSVQVAAHGGSSSDLLLVDEFDIFAHKSTWETGSVGLELEEFDADTD